MTEPQPLVQVDRTYVRYGRRKLSYFSGCDYFRLSSHPKMIEAVQRGAARFGLNVAASRLTTGNHPLYSELESRLKDFFRAEDALLVTTGYMTNIVVSQGLNGLFSHVLVDEKAHPSVVDGLRFLEGKVVKFRHRDAADLQRAANTCGKSARLVVLTDGMFSHDGSVAPLDAYRSVLPPSKAWIIVDEAHAAGVVGPTGRGTVEETGVGTDRVIRCITLSKAFGSYGGAILSTPEIRARILERSRSFIGSTPIPLPMVAAAIRGIALLKNGGALRSRLRRNSRLVKAELRKAGLQIADHPGPIVPVVPPDAKATARLHTNLLRDGIFPPFIRYPGGLAQGYFRFVISSEHTSRQLEQLVWSVRRSLSH